MKKEKEGGYDLWSRSLSLSLLSLSLSLFLSLSLSLSLSLPLCVCVCMFTTIRHLIVEIQHLNTMLLLGLDQSGLECIHLSLVHFVHIQEVLNTQIKKIRGGGKNAEEKKMNE